VHVQFLRERKRHVLPGQEPVVRYRPDFPNALTRM